MITVLMISLVGNVKKKADPARGRLGVLPLRANEALQSVHQHPLEQFDFLAQHPVPAGEPPAAPSTTLSTTPPSTPPRTRPTTPAGDRAAAAHTDQTEESA